MNSFHALQRTDSDGNAHWVHFARPQRCVEAWKIEEVLPALRYWKAEAQTGLHAVGWIAYEASPAFDPHFRVHPEIRKNASVGALRSMRNSAKVFPAVKQDLSISKPCNRKWIFLISAEQ